MDSHTNAFKLMTKQNQHPLLNPLILNKMLTYCKEHRDEYNNKIFPTLRLVCKIWDFEVSKFLRRDTEMPISRILNEYPEGLGWKWNRSHKSAGYHYQFGNPETVEFENIKVTAETCCDIEDPDVIRWFKVMGGQVKSLHYYSPLNCSHQNVFLGKALDLWCPNLETLHLSDIQCLSSLLYICEGNCRRFREFSGSLNSTNLKTLIISVESGKNDGEFLECHHDTDYCFLQGRHEDLQLIARCNKYFSGLVNMLPDKQLEQNERDKIFYQLNENSHIDKLSENFFRDKFNLMFDENDYFSYRMLDWGILGQILRVAPLQTIVFKNLYTWQQCRELTLFLLYQPSKLRSTLKHLEFQENVFIGRDPFCLKTLSVFRCPLKFIRLENIIPFEESMSFYDLLNVCAKTLNTLEIGIAEYETRGGRVPPIFKFPPLPNLKKLVHKNMSLFPLEGNRLLKNCPKLEICRLFDVDDEEQSNFGIRALNIFCERLEHCDLLEHSLRELKVERTLGIEQLGKWLGNLVTVDLAVDGADGLDCLFRWMGNGWESIENVRIRIERDYEKTEEKDRWNKVIAENISKLQSLKFLDFDFRLNGVKLYVDLFKEGFGKMKNLTILKLSNFQVLLEEKEEIEKAVAHIPFVVFSQMRIRSRATNWLTKSQCCICLFVGEI